MLDDVPPPTDADAPPGFTPTPVVPLRPDRSLSREKPKVLPHNLAAEASVLGGILIKNEVLDQLTNLEVDDFYDPRHKAVFAAMRNLEYARKPIDLVLLENELERMDKLEAIGGVSFLGELALKVPTPDAVVHYAEIVVDKHIARLGLLAQGSAMAELYRDDGDPLETLEEIEGEIARIRERKSRGVGGTAWEYGQKLADFLGDAEPDDDDASDWYMRGLIARDVPGFVAGDPKVGKTMLAEAWGISLALGLSDWCGFPIYGRRRVLLMPREDSERTTKKRIWQLARGAGLSGPHELGGFLDVDAINPLNFGDETHLAKLRRACAKYDVILIDSFATSHVGDENSARDVSAVMTAARELSIATHTAIVFIHHYNGKGLNTDVKGREDERSPIHRLRGSSAIAGFARQVVGVSKGPEDGTIAIDVDGNFEYKPEPFVVRLASTQTPTGRRALRYELVGNKAEVRAEVRAEKQAAKAAEAANRKVAEAQRIEKIALQIASDRGSISVTSLEEYILGLKDPDFTASESKCARALRAMAERGWLSGVGGSGRAPTPLGLEVLVREFGGVIGRGVSGVLGVSSDPVGGVEGGGVSPPVPPNMGVRGEVAGGAGPEGRTATPPASDTHMGGDGGETPAAADTVNGAES